MNKFIKSLILIIICLFPVIGLAKENISIDSIKVIDKTGYTEELSAPTVKDLNINTNIKFYNLNDSITYRVNINNKDNKKYSIKLDTSNNKYITYSVKESDSNKYFDITIKYVNEITENKYTENENIKVKFVNSNNILVNPLTNSKESYLFFLIIIGVGIFLLLKKKQYKNVSLLLALILVPSIVHATNDLLEINMNNNITIEKVMLESGEQFNVDIKTLARGSNPTWQTQNTSIKAIKVVNTLPNNIQTIDVSAAKDESIKAYFDNGTVYLYTTLSKVILNPDSHGLFRELTKVEEVDTSKLDTSNVKNMSGMFFVCTSLKSVDVSEFDTSKVTNMEAMFDECRILTNLDVSNFNTSKVTNMSYMFFRCTSLKSVDVSKFDTSKVTNMEGMFYYCLSLTSLDLDNFDTSSATNMRYMFCDCISLTNLDVSNFDTLNVTNMGNRFYNCSKLTTLNLGKFNTSNVTDMLGMFRSCSSLTNLDLSSFNTSKVEDMRFMFYGCSKIKTIYVSNKFDTSKVTSSTEMFKNCTSLVGSNGTTYNSNYIDKIYARIDSSSTPGYFTSKV